MLPDRYSQIKLAILALALFFVPVNVVIAEPEVAIDYAVSKDDLLKEEMNTVAIAIGNPPVDPLSRELIALYFRAIEYAFKRELGIAFNPDDNLGVFAKFLLGEMEKNN